MDSMQKIVHNLGGKLVYVHLKRLIFTEHGCGTPIYIAGTNGGEMKCGCALTMLGKTEIQYCHYCMDDINKSKDAIYQISKKYNLERSLLVLIIKDLKYRDILSHQ